MSTKIRILICDDREEACEVAQSKLAEVDQANYVEMLSGEALQQAIKELFEEAKKALGSDSDAHQIEPPKQFADPDLVIFDNNLAELEFGGARLTAESVIGYIRAFTTIPYIISLNKRPNVDFDLQHLFGDRSSIADLALNTPHLSKPRLWGGQDDKFAPWYWPCLSDAVGNRRKQIEFVRKNPSASIWSALNFPDEAIDYMSHRSKALASQLSAIQKVNFLEVFDANESLDPEAIKTISACAKKSFSWAIEAVCRTAAADVERWLRREILAPQDVLIDLPHLVVRRPSVLGKESGNLSAWNGVTTCQLPPYGLNRDAYEKCVKKMQFKPDFWLPSPCFWWPRIKADEELRRQFFASKEEWPDAVFCEDISAFVEMDAANLQEIDVDIGGSWRRRYVARRDQGIRFSPLSRIVESSE